MLPQLETKGGVRDYLFELLHSQLCDKKDQPFETFQMMGKKDQDGDEESCMKSI